MGLAPFPFFQSIAVGKVTQGWWPLKILKVPGGRAGIDFFVCPNICLELPDLPWVSPSMGLRLSTEYGNRGKCRTPYLEIEAT